jgi:two-component system, OmpR family, KDP operon response regulator KdpE
MADSEMIEASRVLARFLLKMPAIDAIGIGESNMNRHKILIVDDNPVIIKTLSMKLDAAGYDVISAGDGTEAISATRKERPDLILLDINFPEDVGISWDGFKVIAWLQRIDEAKGTPIIVISGGDAAKFKDRSLQAGAIAYFQKPVDNDKLVDAIKNSIRPAAN